jgi:hypothetical protein
VKPLDFAFVPLADRCVLFLAAFLSATAKHLLEPKPGEPTVSDTGPLRQRRIVPIRYIQARKRPE